MTRKKPLDKIDLSKKPKLRYGMTPKQLETATQWYITQILMSRKHSAVTLKEYVKKEFNIDITVRSMEYFAKEIIQKAEKEHIIDNIHEHRVKSLKSEYYRRRLLASSEHKDAHKEELKGLKESLGIKF